MAQMKALVGHHIDRKLKVSIDYNKRRKFIKITVVDELTDDEFEEHYDEFAFGQYELKDVYSTFNAAMNIGTPNVFKVYEEDGVCKIQIAKEDNMELPPLILRPVAGACVQKYQKFKQQQRKEKQKQKLKAQGKDVQHDTDDDEENGNDDNKPKPFENNMALAQPIPLKNLL